MGNTAYQLVVAAFMGNMDAVTLFVQLCRAADVLDALHDGDPIRLSEVHRAFWDCLFSVPENPFWQKWRQRLLPVMANAFLCWEDSNALAATSVVENVVTAHVQRYAIADLAVFIALLIGGKDWANEHGPALRMSMRDGSFGDFLSEVSKNGMATKTPGP